MTMKIQSELLPKHAIGGIGPSRRILVFALYLMLATGSCGPAWAEGKGFQVVTGPCHFTFPQDHGDHPGYRTEWWYYTGNLKADDGKWFGYQLTFFRTRLAPGADRQQWPRPASAWRTDQIFLAHAAVSDISAGDHMSEEKRARGAVGLAGVRRSESKITVHLGRWQAELAGDRHRLSAVSPSFSLALDLAPLKAPVAHGKGGYSRKGTAKERASCYYSITRLATRGTLTVGGRRFGVSGLSWMDHEYSTAPLDPGLQGWDWFSLQFDDGSELMLYGLRQDDGTWHPASSGTFVAADESPVHLSGTQFHVDVKRHWKSPHTGGIYPAAWVIEIPKLDLIVEVHPTLKDQEMRTEESTGVNYWEGSVKAIGQNSGQPVAGRGYTELTGYAGAFDAPL